METARQFRRTRAEADLIAACAALHNVSARSVRNWRACEDPRWRAFLRERASLTASQPGLALGPSVSIGPEEEERAASHRFAALTELADRALERGDHAAAERILKAAEASHRLLAAVRSARLTYQAEAGQLGRAEIDRVVESARSVAALVHNLPDTIANQCNPSDPETARSALRSWLANDFRRAMSALRNHQPESPDETTTAPH